MHDQFLPKHTYPLVIKLFGLILIIIFIAVLIRFFVFELKNLKHLHKKILIAELHFSQKNYERAAQKFLKLVENYNSFEHAQKRLIQCCFAQSDTQPEFYDYALSYFYSQPNKTYTDAQIKELVTYLPKQYHDDFKASFIRG
ncbi:MAG: hypothetical protein ACOYT8_04950 [Candidatus Dependentiae bacterium]